MFEETTIMGEQIEDAIYDHTTTSLTEYARIKVRVNRPWRKKGADTFYNLYAYDKMVETMRAHARIGMRVFCIGSLKTDWDTGMCPIFRDEFGQYIAPYAVKARVLEFTERPMHGERADWAGEEEDE